MKTYGSYTTHTNIMFRFGLLYMIIADHVSKGNFMWFPSRKWEVYSMQFHNKTMSLQQKKTSFEVLFRYTKAKLYQASSNIKKASQIKQNKQMLLGALLGDASLNPHEMCSLSVSHTIKL